MNNTIAYKGYIGTIEFSEDDGLFFGKVTGIRPLISFEGRSAGELVNDFHTAVDDYLELCKAENKIPEKPYKGSFNVRISPELHQKAAVCAIKRNMTLNRFVTAAIESALSAQA